jgi:RNA polymerase sigma factor (sigma-70 family)
MAHDVSRSRENFDTLLRWIAADDKERAVTRFLQIRKALVKMFECRSCIDAEDLADETVDRVLKKLPDISSGYSGDPALYFYGVAKNVFHEYTRRPRTAELHDGIPIPDAKNDIYEADHACLDKCLGELEARERSLIIRYYSYANPSVKSFERKKLADEHGYSITNLRIRAYRIRAKLQECLQECIGSREL